MPAKLKVIALVSGGKDSFFSILHCLKNGHDIVALANLYPDSRHGDDASAEGEDINSFMYQTVGHSIVPLYEQALELPMYRQRILGRAVNADREYHHHHHPHYQSSATDISAADETESLVPLLRRVVAAHPHADAVCSGAILSTYQRTRVESVCARLGLVSLAYLWQYPSLPPYADAALLRDMAAVGLDARIIKVASGGLDESFLWQNVVEPTTIERLRRAAARFGGGRGGAVLGEGGEFETLAIDGPSCVWKRKINVDVDETSIVGEGGTALARFKGARVVEKPDIQPDRLDELRVPGLFDVEFDELGRRLAQLGLENTPIIELTMEKTCPQHLDSYTSVRDNTLAISNLTAASQDKSLSPTSQLEAITAKLLDLLALHAVATSHITSTMLLLRSMTLFASINASYSAIFASAASPPARIAIACGDRLPPGIDVVLSCCVELGTRQARRGLHVQSRSYWAPANIGPYSQAVAVPAAAAGADELVHLAGQIPLVPATMDLVCASDGAEAWPSVAAAATDVLFYKQTVLALQHLWRVGRAMGVVWWTCGTVFVVSAGADAQAAVADEQRARIARHAWTGIHQQPGPGGTSEGGREDECEDADADVWHHLRHALGRGALVAELDGRPKLPDFRALHAPDGDAVAPPCIVAQVLELPRGALVEWTGLGLAGCEHVALSTRRGSGLAVHETIMSHGLMTFYAAGLATPGAVWELEEALESVGLPVDGRLYTVYAAAVTLPRQWLERTRPLVFACRRVWGPEGREVAVAVMVRGR